jgi:hypothetical protein
LDNGLTWQKQDSIPLLAYGADAYDGKYCVVGPAFEEDGTQNLAAYGAMNFRYPGGMINSVHFFDGHVFMGGQMYLDSPTNSPTGFIAIDGDFNDPFLTETLSISQIVSNRKTLAMAISCNGGLFILENKIMSSSNEPVLSGLIPDAADYFLAYPNPTTGSLTIKTGTNTKMIELRNMSGALLKSYQVYNDEVHVDLPQAAGIYLLNGHRVIKQ